MHRVKVQHISHTFGSQPALLDVSCQMEAGRITCLIGPSGCGKTTLLRLIAGLETPAEGEIYIGDELVSEAEEIIVPPHKRNVGFIFQDLALWPHMTIFENIAFGLKQKGVKGVKAEVMKILEQYGIPDKAERHPHELSGGQKQMVAIARSMILNPGLLLMDEPLANVDVQVRKKILDVVQKLQKEQGISVVYVSHDVRDALLIGHSIIVIQEGKILLQGNSKEISESSDDFVKSFIQS